MKLSRTSRMIGTAALIFCASGGTAPLAQDIRVDGVSIIERGVYRGRSGARSVAQSHFGAVVDVQDVTLVNSTTTIPARKWLRFGLRYVLTGAPQGATLDLRLVTRFPDPGLLDPASGVRHFESAYAIRSAIGVPSYREFHFDHAWEIVAGEWVFEFWHGARLIGSQRFCVFEADKGGPSSNTSKSICDVLMGRPSKSFHLDARHRQPDTRSSRTPTAWMSSRSISMKQASVRTSARQAA